MHTVERELIEATGYKPARKFANRQDYLGSILNAVLKLSNDAFDALTDEAATWANAAVEAKNSKAEELPDFDEVVDDDGDTAPADIEAETEVEDMAEAEADAEVQPKARKASKSKPKAETVRPEHEADLVDVKMDKWGAMEGSKNAIALGMFEKGATSKEVKDALGGTYYNILKRMAAKGHKIEKEGSLIKLTHSDDLGKKVAKKKEKSK